MSGVTGVSLLSMLTRAVNDYQAPVTLPTPKMCESWVITRTSPRNGGHHRVIWSLARIEEARKAPRQYAALGRCYQFSAQKNYHPSRSDLETICALIRGRKEGA